MKNVVVYGSVINDNVIKNLGLKPLEVIRVKVKGYERHCNHKSIDGNYGVFNIKKNKYAWINGLLLTGVCESGWRNLLVREAGYSVKDISTSKVEPYDKRRNTDKYENVKIFQGLRVYDNISSDYNYVKKCLESSENKGDKFHNDFRRSSFVYKNGKRKLLSRTRLEWLK